jgi:hypothetical protein
MNKDVYNQEEKSNKKNDGEGTIFTKLVFLKMNIQGKFEDIIEEKFLEIKQDFL